ncbi:FkbM family methyltransferase [Bradyrhizobium sp. LHD-71]|uniref:FkbM family methyltransferase n=1 Tax=Bradyrhizobium sp. LHD-71 TaxID=3072141 RepID=UPI00280F95F0|nr:FkbM family methyltransferase [Bradyrhizobium sp. LHD-71]MDQ8729302.1 FkbM family methyltransferase [Bradyrhizobium sp. LHD-71]
MQRQNEREVPRFRNDHAFLQKSFPLTPCVVAAPVAAWSVSSFERDIASRRSSGSFCANFEMSRSASIRRTPTWLYRLRRMMRTRHVTIDGLRLIAYRRDIPKHVSQMLVRGDYEMPERCAVAGLLQSEDRVLEIGSCVGLVALTAARIVGAANVKAFEPNPDAARIARENFALNDLPVELVNAAVGIDDGTLDLRVAPDSWLGASGRRCFDGRTIATPMHAISKVVGAVRPSVLVIDVEGMEDELLPACPLTGIRTIILEVHPDVIGTEGIERLQVYLRESGFAPVDSLCSADTQAWQRS